MWNLKAIAASKMMLTRDGFDQFSKLPARDDASPEVLRNSGIAAAVVTFAHRWAIKRRQYCRVAGYGDSRWAR